MTLVVHVPRVHSGSFAKLIWMTVRERLVIITVRVTIELGVLNANVHLDLLETVVKAISMNVYHGHATQPGPSTASS